MTDEGKVQKKNLKKFPVSFVWDTKEWIVTERIQPTHRAVSVSQAFWNPKTASENKSKEIYDREGASVENVYDTISVR